MHAWHACSYRSFCRNEWTNLQHIISAFFSRNSRNNLFGEQFSPRWSTPPPQTRIFWARSVAWAPPVPNCTCSRGTGGSNATNIDRGQSTQRLEAGTLMCIRTWIPGERSWVTFPKPTSDNDGSRIRNLLGVENAQSGKSMKVIKLLFKSLLIATGALQSETVRRISVPCGTEMTSKIEYWNNNKIKEKRHLTDKYHSLIFQ